MSSLAQQLQSIRNTQRSLKVGPNQAQPTLFLDTHTATTTSSDLIFTMAVIAYSKLLKEQPLIKLEGEVVMSSDHRQLNRNTMTKQTNRKLSQTLVRFMLKISPFFLTQDCQKILEYLLHNYKVNIFQAEPLSIIYLQYWNTGLYQKLINTIPEKILSVKMPFLIKLSTSKEPLNITFIVKSLSYSHFLMSSLIIYTLEYIKEEGKTLGDMDIEINLGEELPEEGSKAMLRADPRRFLLQIFNEFMNRKINSCLKYILEFCGKAVSSGRTTSSQTCSMVMLLCTRLFVEQSISDQLLQNIIEKLLKVAKKDETILKPFFDFILIIWQRKPSNIKTKIVTFLESSDHFHSYLGGFKCSLWMILMDLVNRCTKGETFSVLISIIGLRIKKQEFYILYGEKYLERIFFEFEKILERGESNFIVEFLKNNFQYEVGSFYHKKIISSEHLKKALSFILPKQAYKFQKNHSITINVKSIQKQKNIEKQVQHQSVIVPQESQEEQEINTIQVSEKQEKHSFVGLLQKKGINVNSIKYDDPKTKEKLLEFVSDYYQGKGQITMEQKNSIVEHYMEIYSGDTLSKDLQNNDFILPVKYLSTTSDINASKTVLNLLITNISLIDEVLYRQMFRLALNHIAGDLNKNYKQDLYFLNNFFKKMMNKYLISQEKVEKIKLSQVLLKVSQQTFGKVGIRRGKYQKIIHNHGKIIAELIVGIKSKKRVTKELNEEERTVLDHYLRIFKIYHSENLYLLNIGIIEILTRRELDHGYIRYFITKIILGGIRQSIIDFYDLGLSLAKSIVFCSQLASSLSLKELEIYPSISSGIAKKTIVEFYGLIKQKFKRVIIKKMLLYIRSIFNNTYLIETFKLILIELDEEYLNKILELFTEFYRIVSSISTEDTQILQFKENITDQITNLFPLDLKLTLFQPLLPNQHIYHYLSNQLEEHQPLKTQYSKLGELVNVLPEEITFEWVKFVRECLKRGHKLSVELVHGLLGMIDLEENLSVSAQLLCDIAEYDPQILYPHLQTCIAVFKKHCEEANDFTLALIARLIKSLGQMVDPYLDSLVLASLNVQSELTSDFIAEIASHLTTSTLIKFIKQNYKKVTHFVNFYQLFKVTVLKGLGDSLNKTLLNFTNRTLLDCLHNEQNPEQIVRLSAQVFLNIGLKMNQHQLRKYIIDLVRWSEMKSQAEDDLPFAYRKLSVVQIYCLMAEKLQSLFTPFYGYIFDSMIKDLQNITQHFESKDKSSQSSGLKRARQTNNEYTETLIELYLSLSLKSFQNLFKNDSDHQFLDSVKNEALGDPLIDLILLSQRDRFGVMLQRFLTPCLVAFHACIVDDYQMKNINFKLLILMKRRNNKLHKFIFELFDNLIDTLQDRFLLLVSDLVPFLIEAVSSRQEGIAQTVRRIIGKIEELSGQEITSYTR